MASSSYIASQITDYLINRRRGSQWIAKLTTCVHERTSEEFFKSYDFSLDFDAPTLVKHSWILFNNEYINFWNFISITHCIHFSIVNNRKLLNSNSIPPKKKKKLLNIRSMIKFQHKKKKSKNVNKNKTKKMRVFR